MQLYPIDQTQDKVESKYPRAYTASNRQRCIESFTYCVLMGYERERSYVRVSFRVRR